MTCFVAFGLEDVVASANQSKRRHLRSGLPAIDAPRVATNPVTERYGPPLDPKRSNPNVVKLRAIVRLFAVSPTDIGKVAGTSRCYVSRILSENDAFVG